MLFQRLLLFFNPSSQFLLRLVQMLFRNFINFAVTRFNCTIGFLLFCLLLLISLLFLGVCLRRGDDSQTILHLWGGEVKLRNEINVTNILWCFTITFFVLLDYQRKKLWLVLEQVLPVKLPIASRTTIYQLVGGTEKISIERFRVW